MAIKNMAKMRRAHSKARIVLLERLGYEYVYIVPHSAWSKDIAISNTEDDFRAAFDGIALKSGEVAFFQIKSNRLPSRYHYVRFSRRYKMPVLLINIVDGSGQKKPRADVLFIAPGVEKKGVFYL